MQNIRILHTIVALKTATEIRQTNGRTKVKLYTLSSSAVKLNVIFHIALVLARDRARANKSRGMWKI